MRIAICILIALQVACGDSTKVGRSPESSSPGDPFKPTSFGYEAKLYTVCLKDLAPVDCPPGDFYTKPAFVFINKSVPVSPYTSLADLEAIQTQFAKDLAKVQAKALTVHPNLTVRALVTHTQDSVQEIAFHGVYRGGQKLE